LAGEENGRVRDKGKLYPPNLAICEIRQGLRDEQMRRIMPDKPSGVRAWYARSTRWGRSLVMQDPGPEFDLSREEEIELTRIRTGCLFPRTDDVENPCMMCGTGVLRGWDEHALLDCPLNQEWRARGGDTAPSVIADDPARARRLLGDCIYGRGVPKRPAIQY